MVYGIGGICEGKCLRGDASEHEIVVVFRIWKQGSGLLLTGGVMARTQWLHATIFCYKAVGRREMDT